MDKKARIAVVGMGALGTAYSLAVSGSSNAELYCVVRDVSTYWGSPVIVNGMPLKVNYRTAASLSDIDFDLILICVRSYELEAVIPQISHLVGPETFVGSVSCGLDATSVLVSAFGESRAFTAVPLYSEVSRTNNTVTVGNKGCLHVGSPFFDRSRLCALSRIMSLTGIKSRADSDISRILWKQFMFDLAIGQTSVVYQKTFGDFLSDQKASETAFSVMEEVSSLSSEFGIKLDMKDFSECFEAMKKMSFSGRTVMLQDFWLERRLETEALSDRAVRLAKQNKVSFSENIRLGEQISKMVIRGNLKSAEEKSAAALSSRVSFRPAPDVIAQHLRSDILSGKYASGSSIRENSISEIFEVSRSTVREALQTISDEGLIRTLPNGRREVVGITGKEIRDLYSFREMLETSAMDILFAQPDISLSPLETVLLRIEQKYRFSNESSDWNELDIKFHLALCDCSSHIFISNSFRRYSSLWYTLLSFRPASLLGNDYPSQFYESHRQFFRLLQMRNRDIYPVFVSALEAEKNSVISAMGLGNLR